VLTDICAEHEMALANVSTVLYSFNLALLDMTQVVFREFSLVACLVIDSISAEVIMRHSVHVNAILLNIDLVLERLIQVTLRSLAGEELVVLISGSTVVHGLLESHFEVCYAHRLHITNFSLFFEGKFLWSVSITS